MANTGQVQIIHWHGYEINEQIGSLYLVNKEDLWSDNPSLPSD